MKVKKKSKGDNGSLTKKKEQKLEDGGQENEETV